MRGTDQELAEKWGLLKIKYFQMNRSPARNKVSFDMERIEDEMKKRGHTEPCMTLRRLSGVK